MLYNKEISTPGLPSGMSQKIQNKPATYSDIKCHAGSSVAGGARVSGATGWSYYRTVNYGYKSSILVLIFCSYPFCSYNRQYYWEQYAAPFGSLISSIRVPAYGMYTYIYQACERSRKIGVNALKEFKNSSQFKSSSFTANRGTGVQGGHRSTGGGGGGGRGEAALLLLQERKGISSSSFSLPPRPTQPI